MQMRGDIKKKKKSKITLHVDNDIFKEIKKESDSNKLSINTTANNILTKHVMFGKYLAERRPVIMVPKIFSLFVDAVSENTLKDIWKTGLNEFIPVIFVIHDIEETLENFIKYGMDYIGSHAGAWSSYSYNKNKDGNYNLVIVHNYGLKWSRVIADSLGWQFKEKFHSNIVSKIFPNMIKMHIIK